MQQTKKMKNLQTFGCIKYNLSFLVKEKNFADKFGVKGELNRVGDLSYLFLFSDLENIKKEIKNTDNKYEKIFKIITQGLKTIEYPFDLLDIKRLLQDNKALSKSAMLEEVCKIMKEYYIYIFAKLLIKCIEQHGRCCFWVGERDYDYLQLQTKQTN